MTRQIGSGKPLKSWQPRLPRWLNLKGQVWGTAAWVAGGIILIRSLGLLQTLELVALDQFFQLRPPDPIDERVVIVGIDDTDIQAANAWPLPDAMMADLLEQIRAYQPRAIGLDIYRDFSIAPGPQQLEQVFETTPNLVGIARIPDATYAGVAPPAILAERNQVGFNNVVVDTDGKVRRAVLFWRVDGQLNESFALKLASFYLAGEGISPQPATTDPNYLQLGLGTFVRFREGDGGYIKADDGGYQILANPRGPRAFRQVSMQEVLSGTVPPEQLRDRIVLVGSTAESLRDFFYTSYSQGIQGAAQPIAGVELHAHFVSQIISAALEGRSQLQVMPRFMALLWIFCWAWIGATLSWHIRSSRYFSISLVAAGTALTGSCYGLFCLGWWIPFVPPMMAMVGAAILITGHFAYLEGELKKSKEFLNSIINAIPDPVFVKDRYHRWIVLNQAYSSLVGYTLDDLIDKSDYDLFPPAQAEQFWHHDDLVFDRNLEQEWEEELTNALGVTYLVATKRSLHRDAAGHVFLVGVIRDITQRKQIEEELRRTAAELVRSNDELRRSQSQLHHLAYYDTLTGLPNRDLLLERFQEALVMADEHHYLVAVLFLDLDGFKQINDTYGHGMGNLLLKAVAQRLSGCLRSSDTIARLSGDEFVVLLSSISTVHDVARVAEKILKTLSQNFAIEGQTIQVTTSIGISLYPFDDDDVEALIDRADSAMYEAKHLGKNSYQFYANTPTHELVEFSIE